MLLNKVWKTPLILNPPFKGKFVIDNGRVTTSINMGNRPKIIKQPLPDYAPRQWGDN